MLKPWEVVAELEADNSRLTKEKIVSREAEAGNAEFFKGARWALDSMITFGVKQVEEKSDDGRGITAERFWEIAEQLAKRELTGNAAQVAINYLRMHATQEEWNGWYRRILIKDLRCGTSEKTINKMVEKKYANFAIPVFSCQLAHDSANHESKVSGKKLIEVKLDGVRVITIVYPSGRVDLFSRNGKQLDNFPHIAEQFAKTVAGITEPTVFDGEIMSGSFQDLMKQVHRKSDVKANDAILNLFDFIPLANFKKGEWKRTQTERSEELVTWKELWADVTPGIEVVGQELVDLDTAKGQARFKMINTQAVAGGYEGIMIKDPKAGYQCKRSVAWLKLKPFIEVSLEVKQLEEGTGKNVGRLGALVCSGQDDGRDITVNVGSGFSDDLRNSIWGDGNSVIGQIVEVRADAITQNQDGTYSLRFPRFKSFRGFEPGEKL